MARALNEFEKSLLAKHPHFYESLEMAARAKARFLNQDEVTSLPAYSPEQLAAAKVLSKKILTSAHDSPCRDPKEFAKIFLQLHTAANIEVGEGNLSMNVTEVVTTHFVTVDQTAGHFEQFMDDLFKLLL